MRESVHFELLRQLLAEGRTVRFRACGSSMWPTIRDGDVLVIRPCAGRSAGLGDVVAVLHPAAGRPVVHRIVRCRRGSVRIQGDNLSAHDGAVADSRILGRVHRVERNGRSTRWGLGPEKHVMRLAGRGRPGFPALRLLWRLCRTVSGKKPA